MSPESPERIQLPLQPPPQLVQRVRNVLEGGGIVAFPTETVYGLAVRADRPAALRSLEELKGRSSEQPCTWHVGTRSALAGFDELRPLAERVAERYWPGPLTLILHGVPPGLELAARQGWTGVRLPAHAGTARILEALDFPVIMSSANRHGEPPRTEAAAVEALFGSALGLVLDGGPSRLGEASGVLRLGRGRFELVREGLLPVDDLRRAAGLSLLFVCTGNTCRSPMAAGIATELLAQRLGVEPTPAAIARFGFRVASGGVFAAAGSPASPHAVSVMSARGIDLSGYRSRPALPAEVAAADRVYCLTLSHLEALRERLSPKHAGRLGLLDPGGHDVPDPIGGSRTDYERCAERIQDALELRVADWA